MLLIPYERFSVEMGAPIEVVRERIHRAIHPKSGRALYEGTFYQDSFTMSKVIGYRDSLLPIIQGRLSPTDVGTRVDVRLRPHLAVLGIIVVGLLLCWVVICTVLIHVVTEQADITGVFAGLAIGLVWYTICTIWFRLEVPATREDLQRVLMGTVTA